MNAKARQELVGIGALVVGLFLGLTLLRLPITGSWGGRIGSLLWRTLGAGSAVLPLLGVGWALAAFERLGRLSSADRKSTRLNSSHEWISYAVFCLKKKKE